MQSEDLRISVFVILGVTVLAALLLFLTGKHALFIMLGVCFVVALVLSTFGSILFSWNHTNIKISYFFLFLFLFFVIPCLTAFFLKTGLNYLQNLELLTQKNILISTFILFTIGLYIVRYEKYKWTTHLITEKQDSIYFISHYISGIENKYGASTKYFTSRSKIDQLESLNNRKNRNRDYSLEDYYTGLPSYFSIRYYSENESQLYEGKFFIEKSEIKELMGSGLLYPWGATQKYDQFHIAIQPNGTINLLLGNQHEIHSVSQYKCSPLPEHNLTSNEQKEIKKRRETLIADKQLKANKKPLDNEELQALNEFKPAIIHEITGLLDKIKSINLITASGTKYTLDKDNWNESRATNIDSPPIYISYAVINNKDELVNFEYNYDQRALLTFLNGKGLNNVKEIKYSFDLFEKHDKLLFANTFEYVNNEKNEFEVAIQLKNLGAITNIK